MRKISNNIGLDDCSKKLRIAVYCRVSSREQALYGYGIDAQKSKIDAYLSLFDVEVEEVNYYIDEGISAKNYDLYLVEGNYDEDEIEERIKEKQQDCKYVYEFRAKDSHLSKQQASEFLLNNMGENSEYVLMHQHIER